MKHFLPKLLILAAVALAINECRASETCEPNTPCAKEPNVPPHIMRRVLIELGLAKPKPVPPKGPPRLDELPVGATGWVPVPSRKPGLIMYVPQWPAHPGYCAPPPGMNVPYPCPPTPIEREKAEPSPDCLAVNRKDQCPVNAVPESGSLWLVCLGLGTMIAMKRRKFT